jgi:hypothetical protein
MRRPIFFFKEGRRSDFLVISLFSLRSQFVIVRFPKGSPSSQLVHLDVPNSTSILPLMVCPKFKSRVCKLKRLPIEEHICFYFSTWGLKRYFYWGVPSVPKTFVMGRSILPLPKHENKMWAHPWTNSYHCFALDGKIKQNHEKWCNVKYVG